MESASRFVRLDRELLELLGELPVGALAAHDLAARRARRPARGPTSTKRSNAPRRWPVRSGPASPRATTRRAWSRRCPSSRAGRRARRTPRAGRRRPGRRARSSAASASSPRFELVGEDAGELLRQHAHLGLVGLDLDALRRGARRRGPTARSSRRARRGARARRSPRGRPCGRPRARGSRSSGRRAARRGARGALPIWRALGRVGDELELALERVGRRAGLSRASWRSAMAWSAGRHVGSRSARMRS